MSLPKVYQNKNIGNINNDQEYFYSSNPQTVVNKNERTKEDIKVKINRLFQSQKFIYKIKVNVITSEGEKETHIIGKTNNELITIDNDLIPINDIIDIYEK